jgi:hypothetical protein
MACKIEAKEKEIKAKEKELFKSLQLFRNEVNLTNNIVLAHNKTSNKPKITANGIKLSDIRDSPYRAYSQMDDETKSVFKINPINELFVNKGNNLSKIVADVYKNKTESNARVNSFYENNPDEAKTAIDALKIISEYMQNINNLIISPTIQTGKSLESHGGLKMTPSIKSFKYENGQPSVEFINESDNNKDGKDIPNSEAFELNPVFTLFNMKFEDNNSHANVPAQFQTIIRASILAEMKGMYKSIANDDQDFNDALWSINEHLGADKLGRARRTVSEFKRQGIMPRSALVKTLGDTIYKNLPMNVSKDADQHMEEKLKTQLGLMAVEMMSNWGIVKTNALDIIKKEGLDELAKAEGKEPDSGENRVPHIGGNGQQAIVQFNMFEGKLGSDKTTKDNDGVEKAQPFYALNRRDYSSISKILENMGMTKNKSLISYTKPNNKHVNPRGSSVEISEFDAEYMEAQEAVPYKVNNFSRSVYNTYVNNKEEAYKMFGIDSVDEDSSIADQIKQHSSNNNNKLLLDELMQEFPNMIDSDGNAREFYFDWFSTVSGRFHIDNGINPQSDKIISRFLVNAVNDKSQGEATQGMESSIKFLEDGTIDPTDAVSYKLALAQALDLDPDKNLDSDIVKTIDELVIIGDLGVEFPDMKSDNKLFELQTALKDAMEEFGKVLDTSAPGSQEVHIIDGDVIKKLYNIGEGTHGTNAAFELARLNKHISEQEGGSFHSELVVESDAITSGMILFLLNIMDPNSSFSLLEKGGVYRNETVHKYIGLAKALGLQGDLDQLPKIENTDSDVDGMPQLTHGLLLKIGKIAKTDEGEATIRKAYSNLSKKELDKLVDDSKFSDFYQTIADDVKAIVEQKNGNVDGEMNKVIEELMKHKADATSLEEYYKTLHEGKQRGGFNDPVLAFMEDRLIVGLIDDIKRSIAKDPVMVYIYGSKIETIQRKIVLGLLRDKVYENIKDIDLDFNEDFGTILEGTTDDVMDLFFKSNNDPKFDWSGNIEVNMNDSFNSIRESYKNSGVKLTDEQIASMILASRYTKDVRFQKYNKDTDTFDLTKEKTYANLLISDEDFIGLKKGMNQSFGNAFSGAFESRFSQIDTSRNILKSFDVLNTVMYKHVLKTEMEKYKNKEGEINLTKRDIEDINKKIMDIGYGHVAINITGSSSDMSKTSRVVGSDSIQSSISIGNKTKHSSGSSRERIEVSNTGAITLLIHNLDGFVEANSTFNARALNIFDAIISSTNSNNTLTEGYNKNIGDAINMHNIFDEYGSEISKKIKSFKEDYGFKKAVDGMSDLEKDDLHNSIFTLMGMSSKSKEFALEKESMTERFKSILKDRKGLSGKSFHINHSYLSDASKSQNIVFDKQKVSMNDKDVSDIISEFSKIASSMLQHDKNKKDENSDKVDADENENATYTLSKPTKEQEEEMKKAFDNISNRMPKKAMKKVYDTIIKQKCEG